VRTTATYLDRGLVGDLINNNVKFDVKPREEGSLLMTLLVSWGPMLLLIGVWVYFMRQMQGGGKGGAFSFGKSKARMLDENNNTVTFADVAGCDEAKEEVKEVVDFLKDPNKFQKLGGRIPRGLLLVGPPGTGKTLLAKSIAGEAKVPFFSISGSDFVEMFVGVGAEAAQGVSSTSTLVNPLENYKRQRRAFRSSRLRLGHCTCQGDPRHGAGPQRPRIPGIT
jgi:cell division protease FtsH